MESSLLDVLEKQLRIVEAGGPLGTLNSLIPLLYTEVQDVESMTTDHVHLQTLLSVWLTQSIQSLSNDGTRNSTTLSVIRLCLPLCSQQTILTLASAIATSTIHLDVTFDLHLLIVGHVVSIPDVHSHTVLQSLQSSDIVLTHLATVLEEQTVEKAKKVGRLMKLQWPLIATGPFLIALDEALVGSHQSNPGPSYMLLCLLVDCFITSHQLPVHFWQIVTEVSSHIGLM